MKKILFTALLALMYMGHASADPHTFENGNIKAVINKDNGVLESLVNKNTGWDAVSPGDARSFEMILKNKRGGEVLVIDGMKQDRPECEVSGNSLVFTWNGIRSDRYSDPLDIVFVGIVTFDDEAGLRFSGSLKNDSVYEIETLAWPVIGRLAVPDRDEKLIFNTVNYSHLEPVEIYPNIDFNRANSNQPMQAFALIHTDSQGLYASSNDQDVEEYIQYQCSSILSDKFRQNDGKADFKTDEGMKESGIEYDVKANRRLYLRSGYEVTLVPFQMNMYTGTWHKGADLYKAWKATWYKAPHWPDWVTRVNSWQQLQINSSESYINLTVDQLVDYARECSQYGVDAIQLTGWNWGGQDRGVPYHTIDPRLGTMEEFKKAIADCAELGVRILPFSKLTWVDFQTPPAGEYKDLIAIRNDGSEAIHGGYGYYTVSQLSGGMTNRRFGVLCFDSPECREKICGEFRKLLDLGAYGTVYDENQHHAGMTQCYSDSHGHAYPGYLYRGADLLGKDFYEMAQEQNPDFLLVGEAPWDLQNKYYATYTRQSPDHYAAMRYMNPFLPMSCCVMAHNDLNRINMCLRCRYIVSYEPRNFKGHLSEFPRVMEYGQKMDALRERYSDYLWYGEFRDTQGAEVTGGKSVLHSVFVREDGKRAVVVVNIDAYNSAVAKVKLDTPATGELVAVSPLAPDPVPFGGEVEIGPQGAVVILER